MATAVVSIICIAMIVLGGMTLSQGILTSADSTALSVDEIALRESEVSRTDLTILRATYLSWADRLRVITENSGQTKLASYDKWDFIVHYYDDGGEYHTEWLPYTTGNLSDNEWKKARIGLNGPTEYFEPNIVNPEESLITLASLNPLPDDGTTGDITVVTPNGVYDSISFWEPGYTLLTPHSENTTISNTEYYELVEAVEADGGAVTHETFVLHRTEGRWLLYNHDDTSRYARHVFPLSGISQIPAETWMVYYRCLSSGLSNIQNNEINFDIEIIVRQADGTVRTVIADEAADAYLLHTEVDYWLTKSVSYDFPGYTVVDDSDYLEISYYGEVIGNGSADDGYLCLKIDDDTLDPSDQTRIVVQ